MDKVQKVAQSMGVKSMPCFKIIKDAVEVGARHGTALYCTTLHYTAGFIPVHGSAL